MKNCIICGRVLIGRQIMYCSKKCANKGYYQNNSERVKRLTLKSIRNNKERHRERVFCNDHKKEIFNLIGNVCECGRKATEIHHKEYGHLKEKFYPISEFLKIYCKYLESLCKKCHIKKRKTLIREHI